MHLGPDCRLLPKSEAGRGTERYGRRLTVFRDRLLTPGIEAENEPTRQVDDGDMTFL